VTTYLLSELANRLNAKMLGEDIAITQVASLEKAQPEHITFFNEKPRLRNLQDSAAGAVVISEEYANLTDKSRLVVKNPYLAFAKISALFNPVRFTSVGISAQAIVAPSAQIAGGVSIGAYVTVGERVHIGERVVIHPGCHIGDDVVIGDDCVFYPRVTIYHQCIVGKRVILQAGAVIGSDGFGNVRDQDKWLNIPQIGRVILEDDVQVGANTTIDRGTLDDTIIRQGARLDNQIQIAHNVEIGRNSALAACVGIAGSTKIGADCLIAGAAMISGHLTITDGVIILGGTLVAKSIKQSGTYGGSYPMQSHTEWRHNAAQLRHLKQLAERVKILEKQSGLAHSTTLSEI
jgi:UDP-3-O-[3-hydroxymyristoyl] glucosamine N-acyltransferase